MIEYCDYFVDIVLACLSYRFHGELALECEWNHDLVREPSFLDFSEPVSSDYLVTWLSDRGEVPEFLVVKRVGVLSSLEEYACHSGQVVLQTVVAA